MTSAERNKLMYDAMIKAIDSAWLESMTTNFMLFIAAHMVGADGYAKTVNDLRDLADIIEKEGMELDGRKTWK
jgi:hypothetical protein